MATSGSFPQWSGAGVSCSGTWSASASRSGSTVTLTLTVNVKAVSGDYAAYKLWYKPSGGSWTCLKTINADYSSAHYAGSTYTLTGTTSVTSTSAGTFTGQVCASIYYNASYDSSYADYSVSYSASSYTVAYNANGGSGSMSATTGTPWYPVTLRSNSFTKTGYHFNGWIMELKKGCYGPAVLELQQKLGISNPDSNFGNVTETALKTWQTNHSITADGVCGLTTRSALGLSYLFANGASATLAVDGITVQMYATWAIDTYTVTYNANGGSGAPSSQTKTYNVNLTLSSTTPTWTGRTFSKWNTKANGTGDNYSAGGTYTANAAATLYAQWTLNTYTVSYSANGGTGAPSAQTKTYDVNLTLSSTKPTRTGYTFKNWNTKSDGTGTTYSSGGTYTSNSGATLYAQWQIITYPVTYNMNGGTGGPANQTKTYGVNLTLTNSQPTRSGYTFKRWNTNSSDTGNAYSPGGTYTANAALSLIAIWTPNTYTVSYNANGGSGAPGNQTKTQDVTLTLSSTKPTRTGYVFKNWNTAANGTGTTYSSGGSYTANSGATLYAQWTANPTYTVTYNANGGTGAPASQSGLGGTSVTVSSTKPTKANTSTSYTVTYNKDADDATISKSSDTCTRTTTYTFSKWNTKADGTGTNYNAGNSITLTGNVTLYAIYTSSTSGSVTLPTGSRDQYTLAGWSLSKQNISLLSSPYAATSNVTLYAIWAGNGLGGMMKFSASAIPTGLEANAKVRLVGCREPDNDGVYTVASVAIADGIVTVYFNEDFFLDATQDASEFQLEIYGDGSYVPPMDYICSLNNRLWGCSSYARTIYASALGDPTDFFTFAGNSLDAYQVAVGTPGDFTGCVALNNTVLFFKQHVIHKLMGGFPAEYAMYTYNFDAVSETNAMSAVNCGGLAVYVSEHGIGTYEGSSAGTLSPELGEGGMRNSIAGYNGEMYALYYEDNDGDPHTYVYDMRYRMWTERDYGKVLAFAHLVDSDYVLIYHDDYNTVYHIDSGVPLQEDWEMTFKPFYESVSGSWGSKSHVFEKKRYTGLTIRMELPKDSWIKAELKSDDGRWIPVARKAGRSDAAEDFVIRTPRMDKVQLRLTGHGPMTILGMEREYTIGSRR